MLEILFMRGTQTILISRNASAVPRVGDFIAMEGIKVAIKEVVWHLDHSTWVEVQI